MHEVLNIQRRDAVLIATIDREGRSNALSRAVLEAFGALGKRVSHESDLRALIITGQGERAFCAGADLKERQGMSVDEVRAQLRAYRNELGWIDPCPIPVIAALNGAALGGGLELALMCDLRVAAAHAVFGFPETGLAIIPGAEGTQRLPRAIGEARAKEMILLGRRLNAAEALSFGLIERVSPEGVRVLEDAWEWILPIRQGAPLAQRAALRAIEGARTLPLREGSELELQMYETCLASSDREEALLARAEKRTPVFKGD
jgi:enoyl-CoA hydratase/carnithine racemase